MNVFKAIWSYLKDWKNLLAHSIFGLAILGVAFFLPVSLPIRLAILATVITLNVMRMQWGKKRGKKSAPTPEYD